jgi:limonene-1,2-epoxide hydrolase
MHDNQRTLENFYAAFARLDADTMAACYAQDARFEDEVFSLNGHEEVTSMWRMLCSATKTGGADVWRLESSGIEANARKGRAHWEAFYRFSATGRLVHNAIHSTFDFNEHGLIVNQRDRFDFWAWARQALGTPGLLLGWTPMLRSKVRRRAAANLHRYMATRRTTV